MGVFMKKIFLALICMGTLVACGHDDGIVHQKCGGYDVDMRFSDTGTP